MTTLAPAPPKSSRPTATSQPSHPLIEHDAWIRGGTGLTNFRPAALPLYQAAIEAHGDTRYVISRQPFPGETLVWRKTDYSLHFVGSHQECSAFWTTFHKLKGSRVV